MNESIVGVFLGGVCVRRRRRTLCMPMTEGSLHADVETECQQSAENDDDDDADYFYELLGAPILLYRNRETYTKQDEDSTLWNHRKQGGNGRSVRTKYVNFNENGTTTTKTFDTASSTTGVSASTHAVTTNAAAVFCHHQSLLYRAQARWYFPMDYHLVPKHHHPTLPDGIKALCRKWSKQQQRQQQQEAQSPNSVSKRLQSNGEIMHVASIDTEDDDSRSDDDSHSGIHDSTNNNNSTELQTRQNDKHPPTSHMTNADDNDHEYMQVMEELQNALNRHQVNRQQQQQQNTRDQTGNNDDDDIADDVEVTHPSHKKAATTKSMTVDPKQLPPIKDRFMAVKQMFRSNEYNTAQMFQLQLRARAHMLLGPHNNVQHRPRNFHVRQIVRAYTQMDTNYIPGQETIKFNYTYDRSNQGKTGNIVRTNHKRKVGINRLLQQQTQFYDRERQNRSAPEYMAPFHLPSVRSAVAHDLQSRLISPAQSSKSRVIPAISHDDPNRPTLFGNCLISFPCRCDVCNNTSQRDDASQIPVPCLLHPVGPLQDRIRLSFLRLPLNRSIGGHYEPRRNIPEELDVDDRVRQMEVCGNDPYVVIIRTDLHCTVVSISFVCPRRGVPQQPNECWGTANLQQVHRIDCRTMWRSLPSFRPIDLTCHPNYGVRNYTPSKVAVLYASSTTGTRNTIHHYQITNDAYTVQKFIVTNLQDMTEIVFANHHPMILYCIGRSYVRPTLTTSYIQKNRPRIGHGYALYSIDLRQRSNDEKSSTICSATYLWSPNMEEYTSEGMYSISGLQSDWNSQRVHYLWVSSISAGKTYLIDTRLPCQCIGTFSLPYLCDQPGVHLPPTGLYGAGTLFSYPIQFRNSNQSIALSSKNATSESIMMSVSKTPGAYGIHLYQIPKQLFFTQSIECIAGPNLSKLGKNLSLSKSTIIPLPDVSDKIFSCGLVTLSIPIETVCRRSYFSDLGIAEHNAHNIICIISLTNKGDIYVHLLLNSSAGKTFSTTFEGLPLGYSAIPVPLSSGDSNLQWNVLRIDLTNDFPIAGHTIRSNETEYHSKKNDSVVDLSPFIAQGNTAQIFQGRKRKQEREPEPVTSLSLECDIHDDEITRIELPLDDVPRRVVVATSLDRAPPLSLTLPSQLLPEQTPTGIQIEHFLPVHGSDIDETLNQDNICRSDLTPDILDYAWNEREG